MQNRTEIIERIRKRKKQQRRSAMLISSGVVLVLAAFLMVPTLQRALAPVGDIQKPDTFERPMADDNAMGDPDAPVVIHEYSDYGCGHCATFSEETGRKIAETYVAEGQVYFVSHSVGDMLNSTISPQLAEASYCAGDQGAYWAYHDYVFANQFVLYATSNLPLQKYVEAFAQELSLDMDAFLACLQDRTHAERVQQDEAEARQAGINSTPTFLINGEPLVGNQPFENFQRAIEEALAGE